MSKGDDLIRLLDEADKNARRDEKTEAARALEAYERRMAAQEAREREEGEKEYQKLSAFEEELLGKGKAAGEDFLDDDLENDIKDAIEDSEIEDEELIPYEVSHVAPSTDAVEPVTEKTVIREPVIPTIIPKKVKEPVPAKQEEPVIEVSERIAADEKRPIHITDEGRLPLSISVETAGGMVSRIAQIGDMLPVKCTREFSTESAGVTTVALNIYAGERPLVFQNRLISKTKIKGIRVLPQGRSVITVDFEIDKDCNINISVIDEGSLKKSSKKIPNSWKPSQEEIYKLVQEAQDNLKEDSEIREKSRILQQARESIFMADFALKSKKNKLSMSKKSAIKKKSKRLKQRIHKVKILKMTDLTEKGIYDAVVSLNNELE